MSEIDDILAEFDAQSEPIGTRDITDLTKSYLSELSSPELLPYQATIITRLTDRIREQLELIETTHYNILSHSHSSSASHHHPSHNNPTTTTHANPTQQNFLLIILQTELERIKYLLRSYLRIRLTKIDKHPLYILRTPQIRDRLSPPELQYLKSHQALLNNFYLGAFLKGFPEQLRRLDDTAGGISMVEEPDMEGAVFCVVVKEIKDEEVRIKGTDAVFTLRKGDVYVVRYSAVREYVLAGEVELI
ncbi:hypothetical protein DFH27DRAFT_517779 [Peziza echinospora]|nr:hypothetical protein DFH27DRAFT_517779 [Peziza echinospora]